MPRRRWQRSRMDKKPCATCNRPVAAASRSPWSAPWPIRGSSIRCAASPSARNVRLELRTASSAEVTDLVRRGEVTLGLRYFSPDGADLVVHPAGAEAVLVVAAGGHRFAGRRLRDVKALKG